MTFDDECMRLALEQAIYAMNSHEVPVGAVIVNRQSRKIVGRGHNQMEAAGNPNHHAEMLAISDACKNMRSKNLSNCDIYVTLEPCTMCAAAISNSRIGRVFYGANDAKMGAVENGVRFFTSHTCHHRPEVYVGIMAKESEALMRQFFKELR